NKFRASLYVVLSAAATLNRRVHGLWQCVCSSFKILDHRSSPFLYASYVTCL
ncbi:Protein of unknown function, partial [Gryllus bimaculatus]